MARARMFLTQKWKPGSSHSEERQLGRIVIARWRLVQ
jgi:hypothetical protein